MRNELQALSASATGSAAAQLVGDNPRDVPLKDKVKTALDETRLLILGAQILFGFQLNGMFQDGFDALGTSSRALDATAFFLMAVTIACLIAPSMQHRLVERGYDSERLHRTITRFAAIALVPFAVSLGIDFFLVLERHIGAAAAAVFGIAFFTLAILFWFGIEHMLGHRENIMRASTPPERTPLHKRIEQMLTEARLLLPGAQALLGFQLAIMLTKAFDQLPPSSKLVHIAALCLIALTVVLLMTPAAIHRITFEGEDTERFHRIGSGFVLAASVPLGLGIGADMYVAVSRATESPGLGVACFAGIIAILLMLWFVQPLALRRSA
jgi:uncharacterized protein DUF6328